MARLADRLFRFLVGTLILIGSAATADECTTAITQFNRAVERNQALDHLLGSGGRLKDCYLKGKLNPSQLKRVSETQINNRRQVISEECLRRPDSAVPCFENRVTNPMKLLNLFGVIDRSTTPAPSQVGRLTDDRYRAGNDDERNLMICCSFDGHIQAYDLPATNCHGEVFNRSRNWCRRVGDSQGVSLTTVDTALLNHAKQRCQEEPFNGFRDLCDRNGEPVAVTVRPAGASAAGAGAK